MWSIPRSVHIGLLILLSSIVLQWWYFDWTLIGFENAEVYGHVWNYDWRLAEGFHGTNRTIGTAEFPVIDLLPSIIIGAMSLVISLEASYNIWVLIMIATFGFSIAHLVKNEDGHVLSGVLVACLSPIFWGPINSGLIEDLGLTLVVLTWLLFHRKKYVLTGVALGSIAYIGLLQSWMAGVTLIGWMIFHRTNWRDMVRVLMTSIVIVVPLIWRHSERLMSIGHRNFHMLRDYQEPFWMLNPWHHTDLASILWSHSEHFQNAIIRLHPAYIGWTVLAVALYARSWKWLGLVAFCICASLGPTIYWMGDGTEISNPVVWLLSWIPGAGLINHHGRWMLLALIGLSVSVSIGLKRLRYRSVTLTVIGLEYLLFSPMGIPFMGFSRVDSSLLSQTQEVSIPSDTRLLRLPIRGPDVVFQEALYEQTIHQHPLWLNPNRPIVREWLTLNTESEWIEQVAFKSVLMGSCVPRGVGAILVKEPFVQRVTKILGEPSIQDASYALWTQPLLKYCTD